MTNPVETRIAADNRARRDAERRARANTPKLAPLPDPAVYNEAFANHGDDSGREFREETVKRFTALNAALAKLHKNPVLTPNEKLLSAEAEVKKRVATIEEDIETQRYLIASKRADLAARTAQALRAPREDWRAAAGEVRSVLRGMPHGERAAFLKSLSGDDAMLVQYAIASVPRELSGVPYETHKTMRDVLLALHDPKLLKEPQDLEDRERHLNKLERGVALAAEELVDFDKAAALRSLIED
jgi:hypothetical protein